jgi:hypothetical protein
MENTISSLLSVDGESSEGAEAVIFLMTTFMAYAPSAAIVVDDYIFTPPRLNPILASKLRLPSPAYFRLFARSEWTMFSLAIACSSLPTADDCGTLPCTGRGMLHVPSDHMVRGINCHLDLADLRQSLKPFYSQMGRPSVDPELMIRMLIVGYSSRRHFRRRESCAGGGSGSDG